MDDRPENRFVGGEADGDGQRAAKSDTFADDLLANVGDTSTHRRFSRRIIFWSHPFRLCLPYHDQAASRARSDNS